MQNGFLPRHVSKYQFVIVCDGKARPVWPWLITDLDHARYFGA
jgi:hypothetical protein